MFVEWLWTSIKYEEVYLRAYETVSAARSGIGRYLDFYDSRRPHSAPDGSALDEFYYRNLPALQEATETAVRVTHRAARSCPVHGAASGAVDNATSAKHPLNDIKFVFSQTGHPEDLSACAPNIKPCRRDYRIGDGVSLDVVILYPYSNKRNLLA